MHSYGNGVLTLRIALFFKHAGFNVTWRGAEIRGSEIKIQDHGQVLWPRC